MPTAPFKYDFVELYNRGASPVNLGGYSVQHARKSGNSWLVTQPTGTIQPKAYFLIKEAGNTATHAGFDLPAADYTGTVDLQETDGKVALVNSLQTIPSGVGNPVGANYGVIDFIGYGSTNAAEGAGAGAGALGHFGGAAGGRGRDRHR